MTEFPTHSFTDTLRSISVSSDGGAGVLKLDSLAQRIHRAVWQYGFAVLSVGVALGNAWGVLAEEANPDEFVEPRA